MSPRENHSWVAKWAGDRQKIYNLKGQRKNVQSKIFKKKKRKFSKVKISKERELRSYSQEEIWLKFNQAERSILVKVNPQMRIRDFGRNSVEDINNQ